MRNKVIPPQRHFVRPKHEYARNDIILVGEHGSPDEPVIPAHGNAECFVDETIC